MTVSSIIPSTSLHVCVHVCVCVCSFSYFKANRYGLGGYFPPHTPFSWQKDSTMLSFQEHLAGKWKLCYYPNHPLKNKIHFQDPTVPT